ncbi:Uncharacterised protein [uncultured Ruminococcus sp.]|nr:Uncharacterised protein [uncultured Ruminococcus sp.]
MSNNYLQLKSNRFSRYNNFVYIDTTGFLADRIFAQNEIRVKFCGDYFHKEKKYVVVMCKVKKKDVPMFLQALKELKNRALLMGNTDYETFCKEQIRLMQSKI